MRLYHGTDLLSAKDICVNGIDLSKSRKHIEQVRKKWTIEKRALLM